jgi:AMMECR1 domain-containing protein
MAPDAWKDPDITVYRFEAEVFGEEDFKDGPAA